jgi:transposase
MRSTENAAAIARVEQDPEAATLMRLVRRQVDLVRGAGIRSETPRDELVTGSDTWLIEAKSCGVHAIETFAVGFEQDGAAIRTAPTTPWSSGQAEGQITKLKLLRRSMYGRAKLDLLRQRLLLAA